MIESRSSQVVMVILLPKSNTIGPPTIMGLVASLRAFTPAEIQERCGIQSESVNAIISSKDSLIPRFRAHMNLVEAREIVCSALQTLKRASLQSRCCL